MRTLTLTLGGEEHQIEQLRTRQASGWRKLFEGPVKELLETVLEAIELADIEIKPENSATLRTTLERAGSVVIGLTETMVELMDAYSDELKTLVNEAYDDEIVTAFVILVRAHFPFERYAPAIKELFSGSGLLSSLTTPTSPEASGESGTTS